MTMHFVVFSAFVAGAFAFLYTIPELPCQWSLIWNASNDRGDVWHSVQQVNGRFLRIERVFGTGEEVQRVYRSDFDESLIYKFENSYDLHEEVAVKYDSIRYMFRPIHFGDEEMQFEYDTNTTGTYYGVDCSVLHRVYDDAYYFVGFDNFPIGWRSTDNNQRIEVNFTWYEKAPLDWFVFPRSVIFNDDRIYTPPTESLCPQSSSEPSPASSSGNPSPAPSSGNLSPASFAYPSALVFVGVLFLLF